MKDIKKNKKDTFLEILSCATPKQINDLMEALEKSLKESKWIYGKIETLHQCF